MNLIFALLFASAAQADWTKTVVDKIADSQQVMVVSSQKGVQANLELFVKDGGAWRSVQSYPAVIGLSGFAKEGEKVEGDKKSPSGVFSFTTAWGHESKVETKMPFRLAGDEDKFIDDVKSDQYNTWVQGPTAATSFEKMKRKDGIYEIGLVLDYNMNPIVKGKGSAIFLHVWRTSQKGTAGCVAVSKDSLLSILKWLDPHKKPKILLNPT